MIKQNNILNNPNIKVIAQKGSFKVLEHQRDLSVSPLLAPTEYFAAKMNVKRRQIMIDLENSGVVVQAGAMQYTIGSVDMKSNVKGVGDFFGKLAKAAVTNESVAKPLYQGNGSIVLEPSTKHLLLMDVEEWGKLVLEDGLFLACEDTVKHTVVARSNISSAVLGGEGLFNLALEGKGIAALESPVPMDELIVINLENDTMKIDGSMAVAWSGSLEFTVEKSGKSLLGSAVSGEGLVNVYRGTGKILLAPTMKAAPDENPTDSDSDNSQSQSKAEKVSDAFDAVSNVLDLFS